jgi:hypothetical protein
MGFSTEVIGTFAGVAIPAWLRVFDCRASDTDAGARSPWGTSLYGSERAAVDIGLRTGNGEYNDTTPISCSTYIDARTADEAEIARQLRDGLKEAAKLLAEFEAAKAKPAKPGDGGSCLYRPVAFCLSNYGWSIMSDAREKVVRAFNN